MKKFNKIIDYANLDKDLKSKFLNNNSFPFIILDNFLKNDFFTQLSKSLISEELSLNKVFNSSVEKKKISLNTEIPYLVKMLVEELNSEEWLSFIKDLTDIDDIFPADLDNTKLANYHTMTGGGYLGPHVDHSHDPKTYHPHVLNVIVYLSAKWDDDFKGATLFYDENGKNVINKALYKPNRAVVFLHTPYTFHGVEKIPETVNLERSIVYLDYYSKSLTPYKHMKLNFKNHWFRHGTTFVLAKMSDYLKKQNVPYLKSYLRYKFKKFVSIN